MTGLGTLREGDRVTVPNGRTGTIIARLGFLGRYSDSPSYTVAIDLGIDVNLPETALRPLAPVPGVDYEPAEPTLCDSCGSAPAALLHDGGVYCRPCRDADAAARRRSFGPSRPAGPRVIAEARAEEDACEAGTPGCAILHAEDGGGCEGW